MMKMTERMIDEGDKANEPCQTKRYQVTLVANCSGEILSQATVAGNTFALECI